MEVVPASRRPMSCPSARSMLKKIRVDQIRLGMHLHALEGAWMDHPFWKTRFVIRDEEQLKKATELLHLKNLAERRHCASVLSLSWRMAAGTAE